MAVGIRNQFKLNINSSSNSSKTLKTAQNPQVFFPTTTTQLVKLVVVGIYKTLTSNKNAKIDTQQLRKIRPFYLSNHHQHKPQNRVVVGK
ncbi:MAG: hypothetical protein SNJ29_12735 [Rikenellaceae bacterium]